MTLDALVKFVFSTQIDAKDSSHPAWDGRVAQSKFGSLVLEFANEKAKIMGDSRYTVDGKTDKIAELGRAVLKQIEDLKPITLHRIEKRYRAAQDSFKAKTSDNQGDDLTGAIREIEIRRLLLQMKESERFAVLRQAIEQEDSNTVRAFFTAPGFVRMLNTRMIDEAKQAWLERRSPQLATELKESRDLYEVIQGDFERVINDVTMEAGLERDVRGQLKHSLKERS